MGLSKNLLTSRKIGGYFKFLAGSWEDFQNKASKIPLRLIEDKCFTETHYEKM